MPPPTDLGHLGTHAWERLRDQAERLDALWRERGGPVDLNDLLPPPGEGTRFASLVELIKTDLEIRWRRNQGVRLDWYVERYEELGAVSELSPRLIYEEYRVRQLHGDKPDLSSYKRRFPRQFAEVEKLVKTEPIGTESPAQPTPVAPPVAKPAQTSQSGKAGDQSGVYRLLDRIGEGSFGEVRRAEAPGGILVAVKVIYRPVGSDADQHEKKAIDRIKNLSHPFLLSTHAYWIEDGRLHIAMELADGTTRDRLKACLARGLMGIPPEELLRLIKQAAEALDYVHGEGLFHRDIKPDNILIKKGFAKIGDFSLVRKQDTLSLDGAAAGTLAYMGPECYRGNVARQSDQYSLAITYFELRTNRRPHPTRTGWYEAMMDAVEGVPDLTPLEGAEAEVLNKALAKNSADRYATCLDFVEALEKAIKGAQASPPVGTPPSWIAPMRRIGPDGYQLLHRLTGVSSVGQFWEAVAPGGKHVALQIIENLDRGGVIKHLHAFDLARCFTGAANILQVQSNWLADGAGTPRGLSDVLKSESDERITMVVVQELADDDLAHRLGGSRRKMEDDQVLQLLAFLKQAAIALDQINSCTHTYSRRQVAIRHCAVRPENLLLIGQQLRVSCFDVAQESVEPVEPLRADSLDLEPGYAAPELLEPGGGRVTSTSDQYSLGMTYVKLRTGSLPFDQSSSRNRVIEEQVEGRLNLKSLPEPERAIIAKATSLNPEDRYPSCSALIDALDSVAHAAQSKVVVAPSSANQGETLERKPATPPSPIARPTPAQGNWRDQGMPKDHTTDVTLMPGQIPPAPGEDQSLFDLNVPTPARVKADPVHERFAKPQPKKSSSMLPRVIVGGVGLCVAVLVAVIFWMSRPPVDKPIVEKQDRPASDVIGEGKNPNPPPNKEKEPGGGGTVHTPVPPVKLPDVATAMQDVLASLQRNEPEKAATRLDKLTKEVSALTSEADRSKVREEITKEIQSFRKQIQETSTDLSDSAVVFTKLKGLLNGQSTFDLAWLQAAVAVDNHNYAGFVAGFSELKDNLPEQREVGFTLAEGLINRLTAKTTTEADVEKLIGAFPVTCPEPRLQKMLTDLLIKEVDWLVKQRYAGLRKAKQFQSFLEICQKVAAYPQIDALTVACHIECLLRKSEKGLPSQGTEESKKAVALAGRLTDGQAKDSYIAFARGLGLQSDDNWGAAVANYDEAFRTPHEWQRDSVRKHLAATAYCNAASQEWKAGGAKEAAALALKHYLDAERLEAPQLLEPRYHAALVEAAYASDKSSQFENSLRGLAERKDFGDFVRANGATVLRLGTNFSHWADRDFRSGKELLDSLGLIFQRLGTEDSLDEAANYWLGYYQWRNKEKPAARMRFAKALALSPCVKEIDARDRFPMVELALGGIRGTDNTDDWMKVFGIAILDEPAKRSERQWELMVHKCRLLTENRGMESSLLKDLAGNAKLLKELKEVIEYGTGSGRIDLRIEARLTGLWGLNKFTTSQEYAKAKDEARLAIWKEIEEYYFKLTVDLSNLDTFRKWPNKGKVKLARETAERMEGISEKLKAANRAADAKEFHNASEKITNTIEDYLKDPKTPPSGAGLRSFRHLSALSVAFRLV
jgi:serine/threonine protein kinase